MLTGLWTGAIRQARKSDVTEGAQDKFFLFYKPILLLPHENLYNGTMSRPLDKCRTYHSELRVPRLGMRRISLALLRFHDYLCPALKDSAMICRWSAIWFSPCGFPLFPVFSPALRTTWFVCSTSTNVWGFFSRRILCQWAFRERARIAWV